MDTKDMKRELLSGRCIPVRGNDIDTDRIIPARYMKVVSFSGLGEFAFYDERFTSDGNLKSHSFNQDKFKGASILLVNKNFGCGSSREHAPQALHRFGITAVIGESFAEIFEGNCGAMGIPVLTVSSEVIDKLMSETEKHPELKMQIDIKSKNINFRDIDYTLNIPDSSRSSLLEGTWDSTASLIALKDSIISMAAALPYISRFSK
ncbi:MAG: 3-isopropylmalate dehydratase small subunit [Spirochaetales bacterium]|nr:3-isopropylmalate dehydratase small subunit [Spirochaetales bacterium]